MEDDPYFRATWPHVNESEWCGEWAKIPIGKGGVKATVSSAMGKTLSR